VSAPDTTACTILLVDDEEANLDLLEALLHQGGYRSLVRVGDAREAVPLWESARPDLVLLDLHMPHRTGFQVLEDIRARVAEDDFLPVLVLTADATWAAKRQALGQGAQDFLTKPFNNAEVLLRVRNLLRTRILHREQRRAREAAELLAAASRVLGASFDTDTALEQLARLLVPRVAERCALDLFHAPAPRRAAYARLDPLRGTTLAPDAAAPPADPAEGAAPRVLRAPVDGGRLGALFGDDAPGAALVVPLEAGGAVVGRLALGWADAERPTHPGDLALAAEVAHRAALAVENARLFREARAATEARERILAVVAHDLRSPLCAIRFDAEMLLERLRARGETEARMAARIDQAAVRMDGLIEDLLDVARMDGGVLALNPAPVDVDALLADAADMLRPLAAAHELGFEWLAAGDAPLLRADGARLVQVVSNLVGNAVKFTPAGGTVTLACRAADGGVRVSVADTGPGIPPEQVPHVFGAFWQARNADRRGLGLGLVIARGIVEAHGGRIWVESEPGRGTTFVFTLPAAPPSGAVAPGPVPESHPEPAVV
jgi:signal transduction histidine kinase/FixJ family two-component response regulator